MLLAVASPFRGIPTGDVDGTNAVFMLAHEPLPSTLFLYKNGLFQTTDGVDYALSGCTITFTTAPAVGDKLYAQALH